MGHVNEHVEATYIHDVDDDRLTAMVNVVREWLYAKPAKPKKCGQEQAEGGGASEAAGEYQRRAAKAACVGRNDWAAGVCRVKSQHREPRCCNGVANRLGAASLSIPCGAASGWPVIRGRSWMAMTRRFV